MSYYFQPSTARVNIGRSVRARQRGLSLIEFLIAITLGLMIVAALTLLIAQQSATQAEFEKSSRQIENGRYAMQILNDDVQLAGFYGEYSDVGAPPGALPDPCSIATSDIDGALPIAVQGYDSIASTTGVLSCINAANHLPGTDILVVRRVEVIPTTVAAAAVGASGLIYLQSGLTASKLMERVIGTGGAGTSVFILKDKVGAAAPLRKVNVSIYFVSPCSVPAGANCSSAADGGRPIPTLKMLELTATGMVTTPLVEGIENLQIDYGIDSLDAVASPLDGSPDGKFVSTVADVANWADVVALRIHVLARNNESSPGYTDSKSYSLGYNSAASAQQVTASTDSYGNNVRGFKRRVFSQMIRLVNPSGRRDK